MRPAAKREPFTGSVGVLARAVARQHANSDEGLARFTSPAEPDWPVRPRQRSAVEPIAPALIRQAALLPFADSFTRVCLRSSAGGYGRRVAAARYRIRGLVLRGASWQVGQANAPPPAPPG